MQLVYDLGMHRGQDTAYYLKRGLRVIGVEADPEHAAYCRVRFAPALASGQLVIIEGAIAATEASHITFYKNLDNTVWGTIEPDWVARNERRHTRYVQVEVPVISLRDCFEKYGVPYFLKIDLEGADRVALAALQNCKTYPAYVSLESEMKSWDGLEQELAALESLGYDAFRAVQQANIPARTRRLRLPRDMEHTFELGSSGLAPAEDPAPWENPAQIRRTYRSIFMQYRLFGDDSWVWKQKLGRVCIKAVGKMLQGELPGWYDTHARHSSIHV